jgi:hypothetical protein
MDIFFFSSLPLRRRQFLNSLPSFASKRFRDTNGFRVFQYRSPATVEPVACSTLLAKLWSTKGCVAHQFGPENTILLHGSGHVHERLPRTAVTIPSFSDSVDDATVFLRIGDDVRTALQITPLI